MVTRFQRGTYLKAYRNIQHNEIFSECGKCLREAATQENLGYGFVSLTKYFAVPYFSMPLGTLPPVTTSAGITSYQKSSGDHQIWFSLLLFLAGNFPRACLLDSPTKVWRGPLRVRLACDMPNNRYALFWTNSLPQVS